MIAASAGKCGRFFYTQIKVFLSFVENSCTNIWMVKQVTASLWSNQIETQLN